MGFPPPPDAPAPTAGVSASLTFPPSPKATICGFSIGLPRLVLGFKLPAIPFPPKIPIPYLAFKLSCKLPNPIDVTAGLTNPYGGGRAYNAPPDPDLDDNA